MYPWIHCSSLFTLRANDAVLSAASPDSDGNEMRKGPIQHTVLSLTTAQVMAASLDMPAKVPHPTTDRGSGVAPSRRNASCASTPRPRPVVARHRSPPHRSHASLTNICLQSTSNKKTRRAWCWCTCIGAGRPTSTLRSASLISGVRYPRSANTCSRRHPRHVCSSTEMHMYI
jgi:hypothetical protein